MAHWQPDIVEISKRSGIPQDYQQDFANLLNRLQVILKERDFRELADRLVSLPTFRQNYWKLITINRLRIFELLRLKKFDERASEIIHKYDKETRLLANDLAKLFPDDMNRWYKLFLDHAEHDFWDRPPIPRNFEGSRRKNWRPLYEWKQRHPGIIDEHIARMIGYNRVTVARKLNEFADEK